MIKCFFRNKDLNISPALCSFRVQEKPFYCRISGSIGVARKQVDQIKITKGRYNLDISVDNGSQRYAGEIDLSGDSWSQGKLITPLNAKKGDDLMSVFSGLKLQSTGALSSLKNNIKIISQMTLREKVLIVAKMQGFIANCYGDTINILEKPTTPTFFIKGKRLSLGASFKYTPDHDWSFFFKKDSYEGIEVWGDNNTDINLFDTASWGTAILLERFFSGITEQWRAIFVKL